MTDKVASGTKISVVIPCYRERDHILDVLSGIDPHVWRIDVVDDGCPDETGKFVESHCNDPRVHVTYLETNQGVGGATMAGYRAALEAGADVIVKIDGDDQMDAGHIPELVRPIENGEADYTKGNRLHRRDSARGMPLIRLFGNIALTIMSKVSSGYWNIMDPTNGFTAIHAAIARELLRMDVAKGFFFESDMLFRLGGLEAVIVDVPMQARYGSEESSLSVRRIFWSFLIGHIRNTKFRIVDTYFIRDPGIASLELVFGFIFLIAGIVFGSIHWWISISDGVYASAGTVMIAALSIIVGMQLLIAFVGHDTRRTPTKAIHPSLVSDIPSGSAKEV